MGMSDLMLEAIHAHEIVKAITTRRSIQYPRTLLHSKKIYGKDVFADYFLGRFYMAV